ncbi:NADH-quinone oxidoreductase subunit J [Candidatus Poribacteria bacterium]|nr:NADH-quinone oxidoreductase subunit J [Candidatus Poribacteria bacterium]
MVDLQLVLFILFGIVALVGGALVILNRNPVYSALSLVLTLFAVSALYVLLGAYFVAAVQVVVYAGAVVVLFLFVIMLLNMGRQEAIHENIDAKRVVGIVAGIVFLGLVATATWQAVGPMTPEVADAGEPGHTRAIAELLFRNYLLPFEVTSVILLAALVGVIVLIRPRRGANETED